MAYRERRLLISCLICWFETPCDCSFRLRLATFKSWDPTSKLASEELLLKEAKRLLWLSLSSYESSKQLVRNLRIVSIKSEHLKVSRMKHKYWSEVLLKTMSEEVIHGWIHSIRKLLWKVAQRACRQQFFASLESISLAAASKKIK
jgi:hypothetical protein